MRPFSSLAFVLFLQGVFKDPDEMEAEFLKDTTEAHCNDGSAPLYYKRLTHASSEWMIYLQGGGVCIDHDTCLARFQVQPHYMTSKPPLADLKLKLGGVFSSDCEANPVFCRYNIFFLRYCSSDQWSGHRTYQPGEGEPDVFRFQGLNILKGIVKQLVDMYPDIKNASRIILAGDSSGALGIQYQGDLLAELLRSLIGPSSVDIRIFSDSGWFQPGPGYIHDNCVFTDSLYCNTEQMFRRMTDYMDIQYDSTCVERMGHANRWKCAFPIEEGVLEETKTPTFQTIYLYDMGQLRCDGFWENSVEDMTAGERKWAVMRKDETIARLAKVDHPKYGFYAMNCYFHVISKRSSQVNGLKVRGKTFSEAFEEWLEGKLVKLVDNQCGDTIGCNANCPPIVW